MSSLTALLHARGLANEENAFAMKMISKISSTFQKAYPNKGMQWGRGVKPPQRSNRISVSCDILNIEIDSEHKHYEVRF